MFSDDYKRDRGTSHGLVCGFHAYCRKELKVEMLPKFALEVLDNAPYIHVKVQMNPKLLGVIDALVELGYLKQKGFLWWKSYEPAKEYKGLR